MLLIYIVTLKSSCMTKWQAIQNCVKHKECFFLADTVPLCISSHYSVTVTAKHNHTGFLFSTATCFGCLHQPSSGYDNRFSEEVLL